MRNRYFRNTVRQEHNKNMQSNSYVEKAANSSKFLDQIFSQSFPEENVEELDAFRQLSLLLQCDGHRCLYSYRSKIIKNEH
jgi:hypothetical protein